MGKGSRRAAVVTGVLLIAASPAGSIGEVTTTFVHEGTVTQDTGWRLGPAVFSADATRMYTTHRLADAVLALEHDQATASFTLIDVEIDGQDGVDGLEYPTSIELSPDGAHLYVVGRDDDAIAVFAVEADGTLTFVEAMFNEQGDINGLAGAPHVAEFSPDGAFAYIVSALLTIYSRDPATGRLTIVAALQPSEVGLAAGESFGPGHMTPDGSELWIYLATTAPDDLAVLTRNPVDGSVSLSRRHPGLLEGLVQQYFGADGENVYARISHLNLVRSFGIDPVSGGPTLLSEYGHDLRDGSLFDSGYLRPAGADHFMGYSYRDKSLTLFDRHPTDGRLVPVRIWTDGVGGVELFHFDSNFVGTPDGSTFYVFGGSSDSEKATVFRRTEICPDLPTGGCKAVTRPRKSRLSIRDDADDSRDKLQWKWTKGEATSEAELGDPKTAADFTLCLYEGSPLPALVSSLRMPARGRCLGASPNVGVACWKGKGGPKARYGYSDITGLTPDGVSKGKVRAGADGKSAFSVLARGGKPGNLRLPELPIELPLIAQLHSSASGACWQVQYDEAAGNDAARFKASGP